MKTSATSLAWLSLATLLLAACHSLSPADDAPVGDLLPPPTVATPARDWLVVRMELCRQSVPEQRARMMELTVAAGKTADERMERLLLASCQPEHTPGLLREALAQFDERSATESERALAALLRDHARSYRILEEKNTQLATQLEATINGIRDIETELDALRPIRVMP
ncbi:MAG: hypothetical protein M0R02_09585 [Bacteroidales bacterium]|nr:hypothetical protein [Bacteroidales bacterium]